METPKFEMPVVGWVYLGVGLLLLLLTILIRGMKFSGLLASLTFLLYPASLLALHWYLTRYVIGPDAKGEPGPFTLVLLQPETGPTIMKGYVTGMGVLGGLFVVCMLESAINYRRNAPERGKRNYVSEDNPFAPVPPAPPPLPGARPPQPRPAPGPPPPQPRRQVKKPGHPRSTKDPFDFS
jgi:hypothetical protein